MSHDNKCFSLDGPESRAVQPPSWLGRFANLATRAFQSADKLPPVGCHFHRHEGEEALPPQWEVTLFASSTEIYGGALDGSCAVSRFMLDLRVLMELFDVVESFYWQAQTMADDDQVGPHVGVEGSFEGHAIWLRITAKSPSQFESGRVVDVCANEVQDRW
ncbi:MAG: hypothetical protein IAG10_21105 [Planctomycetaceae bacterium]|nr:hypothetical protein [Planctomycetaceae bacterium]